MSFERDDSIVVEEEEQSEEETVTKTAETTHDYKIEIKDDFKQLEQQKSIDDKKDEVIKLNNKIGEKYMNLHGQERLNPGIKDRLGKSAQYYYDIWNGVRSNTLFEGNLDKQFKLLSLLASQESEITKAEKIVQQLKPIEEHL